MTRAVPLGGPGGWGRGVRPVGTTKMATVSCSLKAYCNRVREENQWKLEKQIDFEHGGIQTHLGAIADAIDEWEGRVAEALGLNTAAIAGIKAKHQDNLNLQTYVMIK